MTAATWIRDAGLTTVPHVAPRVQLRLLGWPEDSPRLDLDHERFAYAGNFRTGRTGIAVAVDGSGSTDAAPDDVGSTEADPTDTVPNDVDSTDAGRTGVHATDHDATDVDQRDVDATDVEEDAVVAAASFDPDRAVEAALRIRYVVVREDRRGEGIGPRLLAFVVERALDRGYEAVRIGVNNPIAYRAAYRAGFGFTGEQSGMGELVLEVPDPSDSAERYREGLERFADRDLPPPQRAVLERHRDGEPPEPIR